MDYLGGYHGTRALDSMCYLLRTWGSSCLSEEIGWPLFPPVNCPSYPLSQLPFNLYLGTRPWPHISPSPLPPLLKVKMLVTQSSLTLFTPWTVAHQVLFPWDSPSKNTGVSCHFLLWGFFLTKGSNLGLLHCRQILYHLSYQGGPL